MIESYVSELAERLRVPRRRRERIVGEVRDHLQDAVAAHIVAGLTRTAAEQRAVESFGAASVLSEQFNRPFAAVATRRTPLLMAACGAVVVGGFLGATVPQPTGTPSPAPLPRQVAFFVGIVGAQVAVVAGVRCAARVLARWRSEPSGHDLRLIRRAVAVFLAGLCTATMGWGFALLDVNHVRSDVHLLPLLAGLTAMIVGAAAALLAVRRLGVAATTRDDEPIDAAWTALGERIIAWTAGHPVVSCAGVAVATGAAAMAHAETTAIGALPWGLAQAAAVLGGYLALGPALELRT